MRRTEKNINGCRIIRYAPALVALAFVIAVSGCIQPATLAVYVFPGTVTCINDDMIHIATLGQYDLGGGMDYAFRIQLTGAQNIIQQTCPNFYAKHSAELESGKATNVDVRLGAPGGPIRYAQRSGFMFEPVADTDYVAAFPSCCYALPCDGRSGPPQCYTGTYSISANLDYGFAAAQPPAETCGNGVCAPSESCSTCPSDCGSCPPPVALCGNGACDTGEDIACPTDCPAQQKTVFDLIMEFINSILRSLGL
jgi:hypothetical protein